MTYIIASNELFIPLPEQLRLTQRFRDLKDLRSRVLRGSKSDFDTAFNISGSPEDVC